MSDSNLPPEQWRSLFDAAGIEFGYRPLANRIGMNHTRVRRLLRGGGTTAEAVQLVADALHVPTTTIRELRGEPAVQYEPFTLPDDAGRLNDKERDAVRAIVRVLLDARSFPCRSTCCPYCRSVHGIASIAGRQPRPGGRWGCSVRSGPEADPPRLPPASRPVDGGRRGPVSRPAAPRRPG